MSDVAESARRLLHGHTGQVAQWPGLAAVGGILLAPPITFVYVNMGFIGQKAFPAAVIGGFGSLPGAIAGEDTKRMQSARDDPALFEKVCEVGVRNSMHADAKTYGIP